MSDLSDAERARPPKTKAPLEPTIDRCRARAHRGVRVPCPDGRVRRDAGDRVSTLDFLLVAGLTAVVVFVVICLVLWLTARARKRRNAVEPGRAQVNE